MEFFLRDVHFITGPGSSANVPAIEKDDTLWWGKKSIVVDENVKQKIEAIKDQQKGQLIKERNEQLLKLKRLHPKFEDEIPSDVNLVPHVVPVFFERELRSELLEDGVQKERIDHEFERNNPLILERKKKMEFTVFYRDENFFARVEGFAKKITFNQDIETSSYNMIDVNIDGKNYLVDKENLIRLKNMSD